MEAADIRTDFQNRYQTQIYRTPTHIYLLPHPSLRGVVAHYTLCPRQGGFPLDASGVLTLIPDASGCVVLTLGASSLDARMYGPSTESVTMAGDGCSSPPRFFVEFRPGGLFPFTGIPQSELRDRVWPLEETAPHLFDLFLRLAETAPDLDEFARGVDRALRAFARTASPLRPMLDYLAAARPGRPARELAVETGYSSRHLSRLFSEGAGMGYKSFLRVLRINEAARRIRSGPVSLTLLAQELGYYDQAHFIHDFRSVCAVSPGDYRKSLSAFYNEPLKF